MRRAPALALLICTCVALSPQSPAEAAFGRDPYSPVVVAPVANGTALGSAAADGSGGMLVAWSAGTDIFVQRLTSAGAVAAGWPVNGLPVCNAIFTQSNPALLGDGAGGAYVAWSDGRSGGQDIYATRVLGNGTIAGGWPVNGLLISANSPSNTKDDFRPSLATDGAGGAFLAWTLNFGAGDDDIYGAHVNASGTLLWDTVIYGPVGLQDSPKAISDGSGGLFIGFTDNDAGAKTHSKVVHFNSAGSNTWGSPKYIATGSSTYDQYPFDIASDGAGGVYTVAADRSFGTYTNVNGNHFLPSGTADPNWGSYKTICPQSNVYQSGPVAIPDGSGGLLTAFYDDRYGSPDLFIQHTGPYGLPYSGWTISGVALAVAAGNQFTDWIIPDGSGGAIVALLDDRLGADYFLYAVRVLGNGLLAPGWAYGANPVELGGLIDINYTPQIVSDGNSGMLAAWPDSRGSTYPFTGVFAQNMDRFGAYGDARPFISKIADVPQDQGGEISVQWTASYLDANPSRTVTQYTVWRRVPGGTAAEARAREAVSKAKTDEAGASPASAGAHPAFRTSVEGNQVIYWEYVATEPARMLPGYSMVVPTTSDSMTAGNPRTSLMIFAESAGAQMFWQSPADSGYSVDNVPPYPPAPFAGNYGACSTSMHWRAEEIPDLANYRLYRGTSASFVPSPSNLIASPTDTAYVDGACQTYYYRLTAIDIHGNESASTLLLPSGALGVNDGPPRELSFAMPEPNPAHEVTSLKYSLPHEAAVRLAIYDLSGRRVRMLASGVQAAGDHSSIWDLRDDGGHAVGAGLYFARFETEGRAFTRRVLAVR